MDAQRYVDVVRVVADDYRVSGQLTEADMVALEAVGKRGDFVFKPWSKGDARRVYITHRYQYRTRGQTRTGYMDCGYVEWKQSANIPGNPWFGSVRGAAVDEETAVALAQVLRDFLGVGII